MSNGEGEEALDCLTYQPFDTCHPGTVVLYLQSESKDSVVWRWVGIRLACRRIQHCLWSRKHPLNNKSKLVKEVDRGWPEEVVVTGRNVKRVCLNRCKKMRGFTRCSGQ